LLRSGSDHRIDVRNDYAVPLALTVSGDLVGVPQADWPMLVDAVYGAFEIARIESGVVSDPLRIRELAEQQASYWDYIVALADERRRNPTDDFSSVLAAQVNPDDGSHLSAQEIAAHINTVFGGGFETGGQLLTWGVYAILKHRDQWELLKADPSLLPSAVEECVRYRTVTKRIFRTTTDDVEVGGVTIPNDALVALSLASANHDETVFDDPERFDIRRPIGRNLAFGRGMHFCLGAPLAKVQLRITLEKLIELAPDAELVDEEAITWKPDYRLDAAESIYVDLGAVK
jgi:cytochrome P450